MTAMGANIRATWVPAKINLTLAAYKTDLAELVADYRAGEIEAWELDALWRVYTERTAEALVNLERFGDGL